MSICEHEANLLEQMLKKECESSEIIHSKVGPIICAHTFSFTENLEIIGQFRGSMCTSIYFYLLKPK